VIEVHLGEAKKKREIMRQAILEGLDEWSFPVSQWEKRSVAEIQSLPRVKVNRYPDEVLSYMRMPARRCHENAHFMQNNDPEGKIKHIVGWWVQGEDFVLHSVVLQGDQYVCVTPAPLESENTFEFVPDEKIEWRDEGNVRTAYRDGVAIGKGLRADPEKTLAELDEIRGQILSGADPYDAVRRKRLG
jgi:hypothetical protein